MTCERLTGKYVPDKDGKLRHTINLLDYNKTNNSFITSLTTVCAACYQKVCLRVKRQMTNDK